MSERRSKLKVILNSVMNFPDYISTEIAPLPRRLQGMA